MLSAREVAAVVGVHPDTVKEWRKRRVGPPYVKTDTGRIRYPENELQQWLQNRTVSA